VKGDFPQTEAHRHPKSPYFDGNPYKLQLKLAQGGTWFYMTSSLKMAIRRAKISSSV